MKLRKCSAPPDLDTIDDETTDSDWESSDGEWSDSEREALSDIPEDEHEDTDSISDGSDDGSCSSDARMCNSDVANSGSKDEHLPCQRQAHDKQADATADLSDQDSDVEPEAHAETWNPFSLLTTSEDDDVAAEVVDDDDIDPAEDASDAEGAQQQDDAAAGPSSGRRRKNRRKKKRSTARQARSQAGAAGQAPAASHPQPMPLTTPASTAPSTHAHAPQAAEYQLQRPTPLSRAPTMPAAAPLDWRQYLPSGGSAASDPQARPDLETIRRIRELTAQLMARNASRVPAPALPQPQRDPTVPAAGGAGLPGLWSPTAARAVLGVLPPAPRTTPPPPARQLVNPSSSSADPLLAAAAAASAAAGMDSAAVGAAALSNAPAQAFRSSASRPSHWSHHADPQASPASMAAPTQPAGVPVSSALAGSAPAAAPLPAGCSKCATGAAAEQAECWVCFSPGEDDEDALRLISPCRVCSGAMAHIHKGCFRKWLAASWATSCPNCARKYDSSVLDDYEEGRLVNSLLQQQVAAGRGGPDAPYPRGTVVYFTVGGMLQVHMRCGHLTPTELLRIIRNTVDDIRSSPPTLPSGERVQLAPDQLGLTHLVVEYPDEEEPAFGRPRSNAFDFPLYDDDDYDSEEEEEEDYMYQDFFSRAASNVAGPGAWGDLGRLLLPLAAGFPAPRAGASNAVHERFVMEAQRTYDSQGYAGTWRVGGGGGHEAAAHGRQWGGDSAGAGSSRAAAARQQTRELQTMQQQQQRYNNRQQFARASTRQGGRRRC